MDGSKKEFMRTMPGASEGFKDILLTKTPGNVLSFKGGRTDGQTYGRMDGQMDRQRAGKKMDAEDGRIDGSTDKPTKNGL